MGRAKRGGYLIEWWIGDHLPKHVHIYKSGKVVAKIELPGIKLLNGKWNKKIKKSYRNLLMREKYEKHYF